MKLLLACWGLGVAKVVERAGKSAAYISWGLFFFPCVMSTSLSQPISQTQECMPCSIMDSACR